MKALFENKIGARFAAAVGALLTVAGCATNDCVTTVRGTQVRSVSGDATTQWKGAEVMSTTCKYRGNTDPTNFKAPAHLEHMNTPRQKDSGFSAWK